MSITPNESYPALADAIGVPALYFKREDLHPLGSHKGRSIPHMIDTHIAATNTRHFAISSSGNAALAAGLYIQKLNTARAADKHITLEILTGKNINSKKLEKLQALKDDYILVSIHDRPLQTLTVKIKQDLLIKSLRQSVDDSALVGYESLAQEIVTTPDLEAIFIGTSSGTTAQALANYFISEKTTKKIIQIHIVQTPSCHPLVETSEENDEKSIADAIVDQIANRKAALLPLIEKTGGAGWIVNNEAIRAAQDLTKKHTNLSISTNSALSVAGLMSAIYTGRLYKGAVVCIIAGE